MPDPGSQPLLDFLGDLASVPGPDAQRVARLASIVATMFAQRDRRLDEIDPATRVVREIRPLAEVEREAIEYAVRELGSVAAAAEILGVSVPMIYRRLASYRAQG